MLVNFCRAETIFEDFRRIPSYDCVRGYIGDHDGSRSDNRSPPYPNARQHNGAETNPHIILDYNITKIPSRSFEHRDSDRFIGMRIPRYDSNMGRQHDIIANTDIGLDHAILADSNIVAEIHPPMRRIDHRACLNVHIPPVAHPRMAHMEQPEIA